MNAVILAGGDLFLTDQVKALAQKSDYCVAADSGIKHANALNLIPDLIVGDFDSALQEDLETFASIKRETHSPDKDFLDLELALLKALEKNPKQINIFGATGDRLDQSLAAIFIAAKHAEQTVTLHSGKQSIYFLRNNSSLDLDLAEKTVVSLLSLGQKATVSIKNVRYELSHFELGFGLGLGVSNTVTASPVTVKLFAGLLAIIVEYHV